MFSVFEKAFSKGFVRFSVGFFWTAHIMDIVYHPYIVWENDNKTILENKNNIINRLEYKITELEREIGNLKKK